MYPQALRLFTVVALSSLLGGALTIGDALAEPPPSTIQNTGVTELDAVFGQIKEIDTKLNGAEQTIKKSSKQVRMAVAAEKGTPLDKALTDFKKSSKGAVRLKMQGEKPRLYIHGNASPKVTESVAKINDSLDALYLVMTELSASTQSVNALMTSAQGLATPAALPQMASAASTDTAALTAVVDGNMKTTAKMPERILALSEKATNTLNTVSTVFKFEPGSAPASVPAKKPANGNGKKKKGNKKKK